MAEQDYEVGYGKPPKHTRFAKGRSGNPKGRPRGKRNFATLVNATMNEKVMINENGRKRNVTKLQAALKQVVNRAAGGDLAALRLLIQLVPAAESALAEGAIPLINAERDRQLVAQLLARSQSAGEPDGEPRVSLPPEVETEA